jgi:DNA repair protein RadC
MAERLYQTRFTLQDDRLKLTTSQDVTPAHFRQLDFPDSIREITPKIAVKPANALGRFIREVIQPYTVSSPALAAQYLQENVFIPFEQCKQEELWVLCLNTKNRITHDTMVYRGNVNSSIIRMAEVFRPAVLLNATAIILSHCHPSGDNSPSPEDVQVTSSTVEAGYLLGIEVLDHLIIGQDNWVSLKERGLGFNKA